MLKLKEPINKNYAATVVQLENFTKLPGLDFLQGALIYGNQVLVSHAAKKGDIGLYFPIECQIDKEFLSENNLYRKPEWGNKDPNVKGFFEQSGRCKAIRMKGHKSEGFFIPLESLSYIRFHVGMMAEGSVYHVLKVGDTFDELYNHSICRKYVPKGLHNKQVVGQQKRVRLEDSIVDNQFRLHGDTENLRRNIHKIKRDDIISISDKWHGTSVVIAKILVKRKLNWFEKALKWTSVEIVDSVYGLTYSSRKVIKAVNGQLKNANSYYSTDIWGDVAKEVESKIPNGYTLYGEIVGFTSDGAPIQGGYAYGCKLKEHKFLVYRVTLTNVDGRVLELSWPQMTEFCQKYGLQMVETFYYGKAWDFFPGANYGLDDFSLESANKYEDDRDWHEGFLKALENQYVHDQECTYNPGKPAEGIVLRVDHLEEAEAYKMKNFAFLAHESIQLDKGVLDLETAQSEEIEEIV